MLKVNFMFYQVAIANILISLENYFRILVKNLFYFRGNDWRYSFSLASNHLSDPSSLVLNRYSYPLSLFFLDNKLSRAFSPWWVISILLSDLLISAWYLSNQSVPNIRMVSVPSTTYNVPGVLICCTDKGASRTRPITFTLGFPPKGETLVPSFASTFNWSFWARSFDIADTDAPVSNNTGKGVPFNFFFFQAEDGIRDADVTGVQTCALPISRAAHPRLQAARHHHAVRGA